CVCGIDRQMKVKEELHSEAGDTPPTNIPDLMAPSTSNGTMSRPTIATTETHFDQVEVDTIKSEDEIDDGCSLDSGMTIFSDSDEAAEQINHQNQVEIPLDVDMEPVLSGPQ